MHHQTARESTQAFENGLTIAFEAREGNGDTCYKACHAHDLEKRVQPEPDRLWSQHGARVHAPAVHAAISEHCLGYLHAACSQMQALPGFHGLQHAARCKHCLGSLHGDSMRLLRLAAGACIRCQYPTCVQDIGHQRMASIEGHCGAVALAPG